MCICGVSPSMWSSYVVCFSMYGVCMWCVYSVCCVLCTLFASVVNICGTVLCVCGVSIAVVLCVCGALPACGVSRWCMCSSLCVGSLVYVYVCLPVCCFFAQGILPVCGVYAPYVLCVCVHMCAHVLCASVLSCFSVQVPLPAWVCSMSSQILQGGHVLGRRLEAKFPMGNPGFRVPQ